MARRGRTRGDDRRGRRSCRRRRASPRPGAVAVVDGDAGGRVGDRRDVGDRALRAAGVGLPGRLRDRRRCSRCPRPGQDVSTPLGPARALSRPVSAGAADRGHVRRAGGELDAVALSPEETMIATPGAGSTSLALASLELSGRLAVRDAAAPRDRRVHGGAEVRIGRCPPRRAGCCRSGSRGHHLEVEVDLLAQPAFAAARRSRRSGSPS